MLNVSRHYRVPMLKMSTLIGFKADTQDTFLFSKKSD